MAGFADSLPTGPSDIMLALDYKADGATGAVFAIPLTPPEIAAYLPIVNRE